MATQQEYEGALRLLKGKRAKRYEIELLGKAAKNSGSFGNQVREALKDARAEFGTFGSFVDGELKRLGL